jgi:PKD repeat protein
MRKTASVTITVSGVIPVTVTLSPKRGYTPLQTVRLAADWSGWPLAGPFNLHIAWGDGAVSDIYGITSKSYTTSYNYTTVGDFTATATVTDTATSATGSGSDTVSIAAPLSVTLSADPTSGNVPLSVVFTMGVSGGFYPCSYTLDFGDGTPAESGTKVGPGSVVFGAHVYSKVGVFTAVATVTDALGATTVFGLQIGAGVPVIPPIEEWWLYLAAMIPIVAVGGIIAWSEASKR